MIAASFLAAGICICSDLAYSRHKSLALRVRTGDALFVAVTNLLKSVLITPHLSSVPVTHNLLVRACDCVMAPAVLHEAAGRASECELFESALQEIVRWMSHRAREVHKLGHCSQMRMDVPAFSEDRVEHTVFCKAPRFSQNRAGPHLPRA